MQEMIISNEHYQMAVNVVQAHSNGSVSHLQRKLHWGYNRTASAIERMEKEYIVSPMSPGGRREVYPPQLHELWKENQKLKAQLAIGIQDTESLDDEISQMENAFIERYAMSDDEAEQLEFLIAKAMKLGELYAKRDSAVESNA